MQQDIVKTLGFNELYSEIIQKDLCTRCGICAGICAENVISFNSDKFPELNGKCTKCGICTVVCPGGSVNFHDLSNDIFNSEYNQNELLGKYRNLYVAYSDNTKTRSNSTSGGSVSGILSFLISNKKIDAAIVTGWNDKIQYLTEGKIAKTAEEVHKFAKSKYQITPSMEMLRHIKSHPGKIAIVALPCQIHGLRKLMKTDSDFSEKVYCILGLMCHQNLEKQSIKDLIKIFKINKDKITNIDFRAGKWPGNLTINYADKTYEVNKYLSLNIFINLMFKLYSCNRCNMCIDALADFADISFGDFWTQDYMGKLSDIQKANIVIERTEIGRKILEDLNHKNKLTLINLPERDMSKRILNMAEIKISRAIFNIQEKAKTNSPTPNYHIDLENFKSLKQKRSFIENVFRQIRKWNKQKLVLAIFFSPAGKILNRIIMIRKRFVFNLKN